MYDWFIKEQLPDFMLSVLDHPYILDEQKHNVVNTFFINTFMILNIQNLYKVEI
jgi:hypothetical protein